MLSYLLLLSVASTFAQADSASPASDAPPTAADALNVALDVPPQPAPAPTPARSSPPAATDRWILMNALQGTWFGSVLDENRLQCSGWIDLSYTFSNVKDNLPMGFNYRGDEFMLQQNWVRVERTVVTSGTSEPTFGFRNDWILPGSDYLFTQSRGIFSEQLTADHGEPILNGIDPIQFYVEGYFPTFACGLDIKFGRVFTQFGVESNAAVDNTFLSHAYGFVYDPFTQTGVITTTKLTNTWTVQAGAVLGNDIFIDPADSPYSMGSVKWAPTGGRDSALLSFVLGSGRYNQARQFHNPQITDFVYTHRFSRRLNYQFESLYGWTYNVPEIGFANWLSVLNYLVYDVTPRLSAATRLEFFDDAQGQRTGFPGLYSAVTAGVQIRPRKSIILRPEARYDYNDTGRPFDNHHGLITLASDLIVRW